VTLFHPHHLILRRPAGPSRRMGYTHRARCPSFETHAFGALLRMRFLV